MILSSESKLCVTLVLILALLAVLNMDTSSPVANIGAVTNSSSSSVETMKSKTKPTVTTTVTSKSTTPKKVAKKAAKKPAAKKATPVKKAAKVVKKPVAVKKSVVKKAKKATKATKFNASDYLPKQVNKKWWNTDFSVAKKKVNNKNLIPTQNYITGINTVASSLRLANHDLRARPANPQIVVSPWLNTTVAPDHNTKPLGI
jgi:hypothetical protein